jgi:hypothetical protein
MIEAIPKRLLSNDFVLRSSDEAPVLLDVSGWRERAEFELNGNPYRLYREGLASGAFVLEQDGSVVARAYKESAFRDRFEIELEGVTYTLRKLSVLSRRFGVFLDDQQLGLIAPVGIFSRRTRIQLPAHWPVALQVYLFWLALVIWNREAAAAAS